LFAGSWKARQLVSFADILTGEEMARGGR